MKIVAVGGGEIERWELPSETLEIDRRIIELAGKPNPLLLFIPTASTDSQGYMDNIRKYFGDRLGCRIENLELINKKPGREEMENKIMRADIIYVGGGNTLAMMNVWRRTGVDKLLTAAAHRNTVLSGVSAGAICWFEHGCSDSRKFKNPEAGLIQVTGLGLVPGLLCPHYDAETDRKPELKRLMKRYKGTAYAVDNCCALEIIDGKYRVLRSKPTANAYKCNWKKGEYFEMKMEEYGQAFS